MALEWYSNGASHLVNVGRRLKQILDLVILQFTNKTSIRKLREPYQGFDRATHESKGGPGFKSSLYFIQLPKQLEFWL